MTQTDTCLVFQLRNRMALSWIIFTGPVDSSVKYKDVPGAHCSDRDKRQPSDFASRSRSGDIYLDMGGWVFTRRGNRRRISLSSDETGDVCEEQTSPRHAEGSEEDACQRPTQSCLITVATLGCCDVLSFLTHLFLERVQTATPHSSIMSPAAPQAPVATCAAALHATSTNSHWLNVHQMKWFSMFFIRVVWLFLLRPWKLHASVLLTLILHKQVVNVKKEMKLMFLVTYCIKVSATGASVHSVLFKAAK